MQEHAAGRGFVIVDYGSQYTFLIARRLRELGFYSEIVTSSAPAPDHFKMDGVILSGGPASVRDATHQIPSWVTKLDVPILGICFGMQLLVEESGGFIQEGVRREYGDTTVHLLHVKNALFENIPVKQNVWMSHADDVKNVGEDLVPIAETADGVVAAVMHKTKPYFGLQFHPEVQHTTHGAKILENFSAVVCKASRNWQEKDLLQHVSEAVKTSLGDGRVLMAVSGGVDSTVAAILLAKIAPEQFTAVFVDTGLLREGEADEVRALFTDMGVRHFVALDEKDTFLNRLAGIKDPEEKRKIIGRTFIEVFDRFAHDKPFTHLGQGTLYPDVIESAHAGSGSQVIKTHHNVGGLPEQLKLKLLEPFRFLFKDEVRRLGVALGISAAYINRHPFPGPGLAVRLLGDISEERLCMLRQADAIFIRALKDEGYYEKVWQAFAVLLPVRSVGVMGDNRTYELTCALRAVLATDGMTASVADLPLSFLCRVSDRIVRQVAGINRVVYDVTSKPPGTIEWE